MKIKGSFTSVWDGDEITTSGELDTDTGEVTCESVDVGGLEVLEEEFFTDENGAIYEICPECHTYIMRTIMVDGVGKTL